MKNLYRLFRNSLTNNAIFENQKFKDLSKISVLEQCLTSIDKIRIFGRQVYESVMNEHCLDKIKNFISDVEHDNYNDSALVELYTTIDGGNYDVELVMKFKSTMEKFLGTQAIHGTNNPETVKLKNELIQLAEEMHKDTVEFVESSLVTAGNGEEVLVQKHDVADLVAESNDTCRFLLHGKILESKTDKVRINRRNIITTSPIVENLSKLKIGRLYESNSGIVGKFMGLDTNLDFDTVVILVVDGNECQLPLDCELIDCNPEELCSKNNDIVRLSILKSNNLKVEKLIGDDLTMSQLLNQLQSLSLFFYTDFLQTFIYDPITGQFWIFDKDSIEYLNKSGFYEYNVSSVDMGSVVKELTAIAVLEENNKSSVAIDNHTDFKRKLSLIPDVMIKPNGVNVSVTDYYKPNGELIGYWNEFDNKGVILNDSLGDELQTLANESDDVDDFISKINGDVGKLELVSRSINSNFGTNLDTDADLSEGKNYKKMKMLFDNYQKISINEADINKLSDIMDDKFDSTLLKLSYLFLIGKDPTKLSDTQIKDAIKGHFLKNPNDNKSYELIFSAYEGKTNEDRVNYFGLLDTIGNYQFLN